MNSRLAGEGLTSKLSEFKVLLDEKTPHIVAICETWLKPHLSPSFKNYIMIRKDRDSIRENGEERGLGGGVAFQIRKDIKYRRMDLRPFPNGHLESIVISIAINNRWSNIMLAYNPCKYVKLEEWEFYSHQLSPPSMLIGDFNAKHTYWQPNLLDTSVNMSGKALFNFIQSSPYALLTPPGLETRIDPVTGRTSTLDLALGTGNFACPEKIYACQSIGSDHFPIIIDYTRTMEINYQTKRPQWNFSKNTENNFKNYENVVATYSCVEEDLEKEVEQITSHIIESAKSCFNLKRGKICSRPPRPFWNEDCSRAVAIKRRAFNRWRRRPKLENKLVYGRLEAKAKKIIKK